MSELPSLVRVKRKRGADPTPDLFLQENNSTKRSTIWQFRLQQPHPNEVNEAAKARIDDRVRAEKEEAAAAAAAATTPNGLQTTTNNRRKEFRLAIDRHRAHHLHHHHSQSTGSISRKRKAVVDVQDIPTFVEATLSSKKQRIQGSHAASSGGLTGIGGGADDDASSEQEAKTTFKRPNANATERQWRAETWKKRPAATTPSQPAASDTPSDKMVDALSRFALEEAARDAAEAEAREQKPKVTSIPKRPVARYRDRHPEDFAARNAQRREQQEQQQAQHDYQNGFEMDIDSSDEDDYVYDTYIRTKDPVMLPVMDDDNDNSNQNNNDKVGYLVITEQDQPFWETYFEDEESDKEFDTDDEDENAEGYYGADYPEDEVASDDEFNTGAYGYRNNAGSDDEQWDSDTGAWSDEGDAMQNPWKKFPWMRDQKKTPGLPDDHDSDDDDD